MEEQLKITNPQTLIGNVIDQQVEWIRFYQLFFLREYTQVASDAWFSDKDLLPVFKLFPVISSSQMGSHHRRCYLCMGFDNTLVIIENTFNQISISVGGDGLISCMKVINKIKKMLPQTEVGEERIRLGFWMNSREGGRKTSRLVSVPTWEEIHLNYPTETQGRIERLMNSFEPSHGGQLLLFHGPPGTGKTFSIRALCRNWKDWCSTQMITDPEQFFGDASYMMQVVLDDQGDYPEVVTTDAKAKEGRWRLLILEDAGELLTADAKDRTGQGLSRMLNLVDGLIGQGLKVIVLVTTNEPLKRFHPAVIRPGRCAAEVEFKEFPAEEAVTWLTNHNKPIELKDIAKAMTLADLYNEFDQLQDKKDFASQKEEKRAVGFNTRN